MNAQDLKNSILQLAIQGKLVEQREEEGTAKELLKKIDAEKKQLIKEGKIKKQKALPDIKDDEIPFDIPENWKWVRLNQIFDFIDYRGKTPTKLTSGVVLITASNIKKGFLDFAKADFISEAEYKERQSRGITKKGDILFTTEAPLGNVAINTLDVASAGQRAITFQQYGENNFLNELFCFFIQSPHFQFDLINNATGTTAKGIKAARLKDLILPFPPLEEQKRIVAKIEELMPYVDEYDKAYTEVEELNKKFPEDMQKSILQYAIQGKLVEQRKEDGTAEDLYKQIQEEKKKLIKEGKLKNQKALPEITEDEIPFDIPENWKWVKLGNLSSIITKGTTPRGGKVSYLDEGIGFLRAENVAGFDKLNLVDLKFVDENTHSTFLKRSILEENDILITIAGTLGRTAIVRKEDLPLNANQAVSLTRLINSELLNLKYLVFAINAPIIQSMLTGKKKTTAIPNLTLEIINDCILPLPPLEEQQRIVEKIEELLPYTNQLVKKVD